MNRHERRVAKRHERRERPRPDAVVFISKRILAERDPSYGLPAHCYVCDVPHSALHLAVIEDTKREDHLFVLLCAACYAAGDTSAIARKYLEAPDLEVSEGGESTEEQVRAMMEGSGATEH
jgi:hypothetical protein